MNRTVRIALSVIGVLVIAAGSFFGGTLYGKSQAQSAVRGPGGARGLRAGGQADAATSQFGERQAGMLFGQIESIGDGSLVVTDEDGKQTKVHVSDTTLIQKQASVTLADLAEGETVIVSGNQGEDGSITARMVQVSPGGGMGLPGGFRGGGAPADAGGGTNP